MSWNVSTNFKIRANNNDYESIQMKIFGVYEPIKGINIHTSNKP